MTSPTTTPADNVKAQAATLTTNQIDIILTTLRFIDSEAVGHEYDRLASGSGHDASETAFEIASVHGAPQEAAAAGAWAAMAVTSPAVAHSTYAAMTAAWRAAFPGFDDTSGR